MGLRMVETYVPWGVHERSDGSFDFGRFDPRLDIARFLEEAAEEGLRVFLRPGPHINAELTYFGLPERIVHGPTYQARSGRGNPVTLFFPPRMFATPSYASETFHVEVRAWYAAVANVVRPYLYPAGPIVLLQVDNEAAFYFRDGPYDSDYHPDALSRWSDFLAERYGDLEGLRKAHGRAYPAITSAEAPRRFDAEGPLELPLHLDWAEFRERLITDALIRLRDDLRTLGLSSLPTVHNVALGDLSQPVNIAAIAKEIDLVGLDYYHAARDHRAIKRRTLYLAGTFELPYAPELGAGAPPWFTPLAHRDSLYCALTACAYGLRGFNLYMAVDRDRWYGAPIDVTGRARPEAADWRTLIETLSEHRFHELERKVEVGLVVPQEYRRLSRATHLLGGLSPSILEATTGAPTAGCLQDTLGFEEAIQRAWWTFLSRISDALTRAGVPYVYIDSDAETERLQGLRLVFTPSFALCDPDRWNRLVEAADEEALVVFGPRLGTLSPSGAAVELLPPTRSRTISIPSGEEADALIDELAAELSLERPFRAQPPPIESAVHEDEHGPRVLFVMNPGRSRVQARVELPYPMAFHDPLRELEVEGEEELTLDLAPFCCRMLVVQHAPNPTRKRPIARRRRS